MSIEKVREFFRPLGREGDILEFPVSSATFQAASSIRAHRNGVPNTGSAPEHAACAALVPGCGTSRTAWSTRSGSRTPAPSRPS